MKRLSSSNMRHTRLFVLAFCLATALCVAQKQGRDRVDSLLNQLRSNCDDTSKILIYSALGWEIRESSPDKAIDYNNRALDLILKLDKQKNNGYLAEWLQLATSSVYNNLGVLNNVISSKPENALAYHLKAMSVRERYLDSKYSWIAYKSKRGLGDTYKNIGSVYMNLNLDTAQAYLNKALPILTETGDKRGVSLVYSNFGNISIERGDYQKALEQFNRALQIGQEIGNKRTVAIALLHIGDIYLALAGDVTKAGNPSVKKALDYYFKALEVARADNNRKWEWNTLVALVEIFRLQKKFTKAIEAGRQSLSVAKEVNFMNDVARSYLYLSQVYAESRDYKAAFESYTRYNRINDSLTDIRLTNQLKDVKLKYDTDRQHREAELKSRVRQAEVTAELDKQTQLRNFSVVGLLAALIFVSIIIRSLRIRNKQNKIITEQNMIVEKQKQAVEEQKHLLEEKHKEITDSINYAERIQRSFLATQQFLDDNLKDYFVIFRPKDVVSGDFYWAAALANGHFAIATADSTGHGVPGAIMSILNISSLEHAVGKGLCSSSEILNHTRSTIIGRLKQDGSPEGGKDGMDATLLCFDFAKNKLYYSAANNPALVVRDRTLIELEADKMPVGKHDKENISFSQHAFDLRTGDLIYTFTDGLPDQFGGPKGKKFMYKQLKELLVSMAGEPMAIQKQTLEEAFENWKGQLEQVDDVCLIGIRV